MLGQYSRLLLLIFHLKKVVNVICFVIVINYSLYVIPLSSCLCGLLQDNQNAATAVFVDRIVNIVC